MKHLLTAVIAVVATPLWAGNIVVEDAYARASRPGAPTGAIFMSISNNGPEADRLIAAASPSAQIVEVHTHIEEDGIMKMRKIEGGIEIPAGEVHMLERGGDHIMLMGVTGELLDGDGVPLTLTFENAGEMTMRVMVDNERGQSMKKTPEELNLGKPEG